MIKKLFLNNNLAKKGIYTNPFKYILLKNQFEQEMLNTRVIFQR